MRSPPASSTCAGATADYLEKKDELLAGQAAYQESLRNRVRGELDWLSRKARARTRKAQARIDEAQRLQDELGDLDARSRSAAASLDFAATERRTKRLLVAEQLAHGYGERPIVSGLDLVLGPGMRLGLLGAERQRKEHAPAPARAAGGTAATRARSSTRPGSRSWSSTSTARASIPPSRCSARSAPTATRWCSRAARSTSRAGRSASCSARSSSRRRSAASRAASRRGSCWRG